MKIFKLWQDTDSYLSVTACVIIAENERRAKDIAAAKFQGEWIDHLNVFCNEIGIANPDQVESVVIEESYG